MAPHFSLLFPSFFFILLLNVETVTDWTFIYLACTHHFNHLVCVTAGGPEFPRGHMKPSSTFVLKFIEIVILWIYYMESLLASASFWYFCDISFQLFKILCLAKNHWRWFCAPNAHMVHIVNDIRFKMVYTSWSFIFQLLHSLCECHCWWTRESLRAHAAKFYGRLQLIREHQHFSCWNLLKL